jgi:spore germination cell wall hydrolase CwlJ-like protein
MGQLIREFLATKNSPKKHLQNIKSNIQKFTKAPSKADTDPPPGAGDLPATFITKSLTDCLANAPSAEGRQYSMMRSLSKAQSIIIRRTNRIKI